MIVDFPRYAFLHFCIAMFLIFAMVLSESVGGVWAGITKRKKKRLIASDVPRCFFYLSDANGGSKRLSLEITPHAANPLPRSFTQPHSHRAAHWKRYGGKWSRDFAPTGLANSKTRFASPFGSGRMPSSGRGRGTIASWGAILCHKNTGRGINCSGGKQD